MSSRLAVAVVLAATLGCSGGARAKEPASAKAASAKVTSAKTTPAKAAPPKASAPVPKRAAPSFERETSGPPTPAKQRQKACGAEWRGLSAAEKSAKGPGWPQFYSKCVKRLKAKKD